MRRYAGNPGQVGCGCGDVESEKIHVETDWEGGNAQTNRILFPKDDLLQFWMSKMIGDNDSDGLEFYGCWELEFFLKSMRSICDQIYPREGNT